MIMGTTVWRSRYRWLIVLLAGYLAARVAVLAGSPVFTGYDTATYAVRHDPALDHGSLVSLIGDAPRLWGVPLFYAVLPSDALRAAGQWAVATLAWGCLAWVVWTLQRHLLASVLGSGAILLLALTDNVGSWDLALLSESLSISLGVLTLALLLRWVATGSRLAAAGMTVSAFWWTFTRPDTRVYTVMLIAVLAVVAWRAPVRRVAATVAAVALITAVAWCSAIVPRTAEPLRPYGAFGAYAADEWIMYRLRVQVLPDPAIRAVFVNDLGMPACAAVDEIAARPTWDMDEFAVAYRSCPDLKAWGDENRDTAFRRFAVVAPGEYTRMTIDLVAQSLSGRPSNPDVLTIIPTPVRALAFVRTGLTLPLVLGALVLAVAAVIATGAHRRRRMLVLAAAVLTGASLVSTGAGVLFGTGEFWRFGIQEAIAIRISIIFMLVAALDSALERRGQHRAANHSPSPSGADGA